MDEISIPPITINGKYLYKGSERFIARGVVYRPEIKTLTNFGGPVSDALDDMRGIEIFRNAQALEDVGINTLWTTGIDPVISHRQTMNHLASKGIYVIFEVDYTGGPGERELPEMYNEDTLEDYSTFIDSVAMHPNTLGICVSSSTAIALSHPDPQELCRRQSHLIRDLKQYMRFRNYECGQRIIPLCIRDSQWISLNTDTFQFFTHPDVSGRAAGGKPDFYTFIHYDCHTAANRPTIEQVHKPEPTPLTTTTQGQPESQAQVPSWAEQLPMQKFIDAREPIPVLVAEYGHRVKRRFRISEVHQLYGKSMSSPLLRVLSGGFWNQFFDGEREFGLVTVDSAGALVRTPDYNPFKYAMAWATESPPKEDHKVDEYVQVLRR